MPIIYEPKGRAAEYSLLAINHYEGCDHKCKYCYVPLMPQWKDRDFFNTPARPRKDVLDRIEKEIPKYAGTDKRVLLCFMGDPYPKIDFELRITRQIIKMLVNNSIPFQVLTKAGTRAARDFDLYTGKDAFAVSLAFLDDEKAREYEPFAAPPKSRIEALHLAKAWDIETWVSLEPVIDEKESLEIIKKTANVADLYKIGKLNHYKSDINWRKFGMAAVRLCRQLGKNYFIKKDLAELMTDFQFCSVDNRIIKRNG